MSESLVNQYALHWAIGFLVVYLVVQLLVSKHAFFQSWSPVRKSLAVKIIALVGFTLLYVLVKVSASSN